MTEKIIPVKSLEKAKMIKVCLVSPLPPPYGGISHWTKLIFEHSKNLDDISIKVVDTATRWRAVHDLRKWKRIIFGSLQLTRDLLNIVKCILYWRPDVLHITTSGQFGIFRDLTTLFLAKLFKIPTIYHIRFGRLAELYKNPTLEWHLFSVATNLATKIISIDKSTYDVITQISSIEKSHLIPNCFDPEKIPKHEKQESLSQKNIVTYLGWIIPTKGITELINAWKKSHHPGWELILIGPGDEDYISNLVEGYSANDIQFIGQKSHAEAMKILACSSIFILPSHTEGFPNVIIEAMAIGLPIIASGVGAIPEMLNENCGIIIPPKNEEILASEIEKLIQNPSLRISISHAAKNKAYNQYSLTNIFERYKNIWKSLC